MILGNWRRSIAFYWMLPQIMSLLKNSNFLNLQLCLASNGVTNLMWDWAKCINVCSALLITKITLVSKIKKIMKCYKNSNSQQFIFDPAYFITECLFTLGANSQPWWQTLFTLTPPTNMWLVNITKDLFICSCGADSKASDVLILMRSTHQPVGKLFSLSSNLMSHRKGIYLQ